MKILRRIGQGAFKVLRPKNDNQSEISLLDIKELYDRAYGEKAKAKRLIKTYKSLLGQAEKLDKAYRVQIKQGNPKKYGGLA